MVRHCFIFFMVALFLFSSVKSFQFAFNPSIIISKQSVNFYTRTHSLNMAIKRPACYTSNDWFENLLSLPTSRIFKRTKNCILQNVIWTTILVFIFKKFKSTFAFPSTVHSISGSALSLLLVFRTNSSYDRFWEARKVWGTLAATCRDVARMGQRVLPENCHDRLGKLLVAFAITLKQHLQGKLIY